MSDIDTGTEGNSIEVCADHNAEDPHTNEPAEETLDAAGEDSPNRGAVKEDIEIDTDNTSEADQVGRVVEKVSKDHSEVIAADKDTGVEDVGPSEGPT